MPYMRRVCLVAFFLTGCQTLTTVDPLATTADPFSGSSVTINPSTLAADGNTKATVTVTLQDGSGSPRSGVSVVLSASGNQVVLSQPTLTTDSAGVTEGAVRSSVAGDVNIVARPLISGSPVDFGLHGVAHFIGSGVQKSHLTLSAIPNGNISVDTNTQITLVATLKDGFGSGVAAMPISFTAQANATLAITKQATTNAAGQASATFEETAAGVYTFEASSPKSDSVFTFVNLLPGAPVLAQSSYTLSPNGVPNDGVTAAVMTTTVRDQYGNPTPGVAVSAQASDGNVSIGTQQSVTDQQGQFVAPLTSPVAGIPKVTVSVGTLIFQAAPRFGLTAPDAPQTHVVVPPAPIVADGVSPAYLTAVVEDANGNQLPNVWVAWQVSGQNNSLAPAAGPTATDGAAATVLYSTTAEVKQVQATVGSVVASQNITFVPGPVSSSQSSVATVPAAINLKQSTRAAVRVALKDAAGNAIAGTPIVLSSSSNDIMWDINQLTSDSNGLASTNLSATVAETKTLYAQAQETNVVGSVLVSAGNPNAQLSRWTALPTQSTVADLASRANIQVLIKDAWGNPVSNQNVFLATTNNYNDIRLPAAGQTDSNGLWGSSVVSKRAGLDGVLVQAATVALSGNLTFVAGPASQGNSVLTCSPNALVASTSNQLNVGGSFADKFGNPASGQNVNLTLLSPRGHVTAQNAVLDGSGVLSSSFTGLTEAGWYVLSALTGQAVLNQNVAVSRASTSMLGVATRSAVSAGFGYDVTVSATDAFGNVDPNFVGQVAFSASDANANVPPTYAFSAGDAGQHTFAGGLTWLRPGTQTLLAACSSPNIAGTANTVVGLPVGPWLSVAPAAQTLERFGAPSGASAPNSLLTLSPRGMGLYQKIQALSDGTLRLMGRCLDAGTQPSSGQNIVMGVCNYAPSQAWSRSDAQLISQANPNLCLGVTNASSTSATLTACSDSNAQLQMRPTAPSTYFFTDQTQNSLQFPGGQAVAGKAPISDTFSGSSGLWPMPDGSLRSGANLCLDVNGQVAAGSGLVLSTCASAFAPLWQLDGESLHPQSTPSLCVDMGAGLGSAVRLANCSGAASQQLATLELSTTSSLVTTINASPACIQATSQQSADGDPWAVDSCRGTARDSVAFLPASTGANGLHLVLPLMGWPMAMDHNGALSGNALVMTSSPSSAQAFALVPSAQATYAVVVALDGNQTVLDVASATSSGGVALTTNTSSQTQELRLDSQLIQFQAEQSPALCIGAEDAVTADSLRALFVACANNSNQQFLPTAQPNNIHVAATPILFGGRCLDSNASTLSPNTAGWTPCSDSPSQLWSLPFGTGALLSQDGRCLNANSATLGQPAQTVDCHAGDQNFVQVRP